MHGHAEYLFMFLTRKLYALYPQSSQWLILSISNLWFVSCAGERDGSVQWCHNAHPFAGPTEAFALNVGGLSRASQIPGRLPRVIWRAICNIFPWNHAFEYFANSCTIHLPPVAKYLFCFILLFGLPPCVSGSGPSELVQIIIIAQFENSTNAVMVLFRRVLANFRLCSMGKAAIFIFCYSR